MKKWLLVTLAILCVLVLIGYGGFTIQSLAYTGGYSEGEIAGYDNGYSAGHETGYDSGKQEGYQAGREEGYSEGYQAGSEEGYAEGFGAGLGHGYTLKDPTYEEAVTFMREDNTNENEYNENSYVCSHFSRDVSNNAEQQGLRCALVVINHPQSSHTIIAFDTIDQGLVFYEPQTDERVRPVVGSRYYRCVEPMPGYYYEPPSYDDTIEEILVIW